LALGPNSFCSFSASAPVVNALLASKPSLGIIEVEEYSTEEEEVDDLYSDYSNGTPPEETDDDPNIDAVVQSFLNVVGKCSEITHQVGLILPPPPPFHQLNLLWIRVKVL
jgi:hypothetical protein